MPLLGGGVGKDNHTDRYYSGGAKLIKFHTGLIQEQERGGGGDISQGYFWGLFFFVVV